jgi:hypothetical protein
MIRVSESVFYAYNQYFGSGPGFAWIRIEFDGLDRIRIQMGKKDTHRKIEKVKKCIVLECWMFSFECFSCSLEVLHGTQGPKNIIFLEKQFVQL